MLASQGLVSKRALKVVRALLYGKKAPELFPNEKEIFVPEADAVSVHTQQLPSQFYLGTIKAGPAPPSNKS